MATRPRRLEETSAKMFLAHVVRQTNAALLYADEVTLVSPSAAFMQSLERLGGLDEGTLFRALQALTIYAPFSLNSWKLMEYSIVFPS